MSIRQQGRGRCRPTSPVVRGAAAARPAVERLEGRRLFSARLIGITGNKQTPSFIDETLYEINQANASVTQLVTLPFVPDTDAIGYNPESGLLHRTSGASSYKHDPLSIGYRDNQFMQTVDMRTPAMTQRGIFNANFQGEPGAGPYGIDAPRPTWVFPADRRTDAQTDTSFGAQGPNEYHALRDLTWSNTERLFFGADEGGIFKLTAAGESTFLGNPAGLAGGPKGLTFFTINGERRLLVGEKDGSNLYTVDPLTGATVGSPVPLVDATTSAPFLGVLSLVEHPDGTTLLAIANSPTSESAFERLLVRIDPVTGVSTRIGALGVHMADLAFVPAAPTEVFGRRVFYNNSAADGNTAGAAAQDDAAVDPTKSGATPGGTVTTANVTGYVKGLNGVMVDVFSLPSGTTTLTAADFTIRTASMAAPNAWAAGPAPMAVDIRRGAGPGNNDRVTLIWNDYDPNANPANEAVGNGWLEVTVKANANTGLAAPVTFVLGNLLGDVNGDRAVNGTDFALLASNFGRVGVPTAGGDLNADSAVNGTDFAILAGNFGRTLAPPPAALQQVATPAARSANEGNPRRVIRAAKVLAVRQRRNPLASFGNGNRAIGRSGS